MVLLDLTEVYPTTVGTPEVAHRRKVASAGPGRRPGRAWQLLSHMAMQLEERIEQRYLDALPEAVTSTRDQGRHNGVRGDGGCVAGAKRNGVEDWPVGGGPHARVVHTGGGADHTFPAAHT